MVCAAWHGTAQRITAEWWCLCVAALMLTLVSIALHVLQVPRLRSPPFCLTVSVAFVKHMEPFVQAHAVLAIHML